MGYTRRDFIDGALAEIGFANYAFDVASEQLEAVKRRLDGMMAEWNAKGIRLGYPLPSSPANSQLDEQTTVPDSAFEAITANLAIRIAPMFGKQVMAETKRTAKGAYNTLIGLAAVPMEMQLPRMPSGSGNKGWRWDDPFTNYPSDPLLAGGDGPLEFS